MNAAASVWPAPAKINLMLRITGRRPDGYHLLQTVFQFVDLADELQISVRADGIIRRTSANEAVRAEDDLVVRAAGLLQACTGGGQGADIRVEKRIPMGAGLGGGSSNAATTLVALNRLWDCGLETETLMDLGLQLGADVPVFVHGRAAWAEGVGERLSAISPAERHYLVIVPPVHVDTGKVFQDPELTRNSPRITIRDFLAGERGNDCLSVVRKRYPRVAAAYDWLSERAAARMTGTGACVFAECEGPHQGEQWLRDVPEDMTGFVVRGLNRSPLLDRAAMS